MCVGMCVCTCVRARVDLAADPAAADSDAADHVARYYRGSRKTSIPFIQVDRCFLKNDSFG